MEPWEAHELEIEHMEAAAEALREDRRRVRRITVDFDQIITLFQAVTEKWDCVAFPEFTDLPKGYEVRGAHSDCSRFGVSLLIYHPSFDPVPPGNEIPYVTSPLAMRQTAYCRPRPDE